MPESHTREDRKEDLLNESYLKAWRLSGLLTAADCLACHLQECQDESAQTGLYHLAWTCRDMAEQLTSDLDQLSKVRR